MAIKDTKLYLDNSGNIIGRSFTGTPLERIVKDTIPSEYTYTTKYGLYEEISKLGDFQDILNSSKLSIGEILITKTGDGKITVSRLRDLPGEGIRNGTKR